MSDYSQDAAESLLNTGLEAARAEVARRLKVNDLPLSFTIQELVVSDPVEGNGWQSNVQDTQVGGLYHDEVLRRVGDDTVPLAILGLREQLTPLADYLAESTDLATRRYGVFSGPGISSVDVVLTRCISPLATYYLRSLSDLSNREDDLVSRLGAELGRLVTGDTVDRVFHLPVSGVRPENHLHYRGVSIRALSPRERGAWVELNLPIRNIPVIRGTDYRPHVPFPNFAPSTLLEIVSARPVEQQRYDFRLPSKIVLAFFLAGYDLNGPGYITNFDWPAWAANGRWNTPFPLSAKINAVKDVVITEDSLKEVVDLAYKLPDFGSAETSGKEVVLSRALKAFGAPSGGSEFLDLAIALEAALLAGTQAELSYRFSLYGALFLRGQLDPTETFDRLKNIYNVRSALVHGGKVKSDALTRATRDAPELVKAVIVTAVRTGWPSTANLDHAALE
jgi:Apea-like HEPN